MGRLVLMRNRFIAIAALCVMSSFGWVVAAQAPPGPDTSKPVEQSAGQEKSKPGLRGGAPNGKRLSSEDGNFQVLPGNTRNGERARYFSLERGEWEEISAWMM